MMKSGKQCGGIIAALALAALTALGVTLAGCGSSSSAHHAHVLPAAQPATQPFTFTWTVGWIDNGVFLSVPGPGESGDLRAARHEAMTAPLWRR
jgi:hypothetical protein